MTISIESTSMHPQVESRYNMLIHVLICWSIFTAFYWAAAYYKPFHVDEFYSWVYAERCTFRDILLLKDSGIGHPPLYHLLQKLVQISLPTYHPWQVRLGNYLPGSLFVALLAMLLLREKRMPIFCYAISSSAGLLNVFVFSRMWGLVCFSSLLLLWRGEEYAKNQEIRNLLLLLGAFILGIVSDYNFILLIPYGIIVLFSRTRNVRYVTYLLPLLLCAAWIFLAFRFSVSSGHDIVYGFFSIMESLMTISHEMGITLLDFWFTEPFLLALGIGVLWFWLCFTRERNKVRDKRDIDVLPFVILIAVTLIAAHTLVGANIIRVRQAMAYLAFIFAIVVWLMRQKRFIWPAPGDVRLWVSIVCGVLILLCINSTNLLFWTDLRHARFQSVLLPFILLLIYRALNPRMAYAMILIFFVSGLLYITSSGISDYFPPPVVEKTYPVFYYNEFAYSNQYLSGERNASADPFILRPKFNTFCRVCEMGTSNVSYDDFTEVRVVAVDLVDPRMILGSQFVQFGPIETSLTHIDNFQYRYFTPIYPRYYTVTQYRRVASLDKPPETTSVR
jgi:hypothetical protein